jgi:hypothetical protein
MCRAFGVPSSGHVGDDVVQLLEDVARDRIGCSTAGRKKKIGRFDSLGFKPELQELFQYIKLVPFRQQSYRNTTAGTETLDGVIRGRANEDFRGLVKAEVADLQQAGFFSPESTAEA